VNGAGRAIYRLRPKKSALFSLKDALNGMLDNVGIIERKFRVPEQ
jgi:hypothetical protein